MNKEYTSLDVHVLVADFRSYLALFRVVNEQVLLERRQNLSLIEQSCQTRSVAYIRVASIHNV